MTLSGIRCRRRPRRGSTWRLLRDVRRRSGLTYRELARRASAAGHWLPPSTLATMLGRTTLPRERTVVALLAACGTPAVEVDRWLETRRDLEARLGEQGRGESEAVRTPAGPSTTVAADIRPSVGSVPPRPEAPWPARRWLRLALLAVLGVLTVGATGALRPLAPPTVDSSPTVGCPEVLRQGMYGPCVLSLQEHLVADGLSVPVDGWFGPDTTSRVIVFQAFGGLPVSGTADERLFDELAGDRKVPAQLVGGPDRQTSAADVPGGPGRGGAGGALPVRAWTRTGWRSSRTDRGAGGCSSSATWRCPGSASTARRRWTRRGTSGRRGRSGRVPATSATGTARRSGDA